MDEDFLVRAIDLSRYEAGVRRRIVILLEEMAADVAARLAWSGGPLTDFNQRRLNALLAEIRATVAAYYNDIAAVHAEALAGLAIEESRFVGSRVSEQPTLPSASTLNTLVSRQPIFGANLGDWWSRQSGDTMFRFAAAIRQGIVQGETNAQIIKRLHAAGGDVGQIVQSRRNAEALVRSSIATISNQTRLETYRANDSIVKGVRQLSTLDDRTTDICIAYDGQEWDLDGKPINGSTLPFNGGPPRHWNCRSTLLPITKTYRELGINIPEYVGARSSDTGPISARTRFGDWLKGKPEAYQDRLLGKGRAALWRSGKISLQQLLDQSGRPLTLEQLQARS